jgi:hypothetical protein
MCMLILLMIQFSRYWDYPIFGENTGPSVTMFQSYVPPHLKVGANMDTANY